MVRALSPLVLCLALGCAAAQSAAAKDPMRCERDPACAKQRAKSRDCTTQCVDDPACIDRCRQAQSDGLGQPP